MQAWDRYAFVNNNPIKYIDPSGHDLEQIIFNKRGELPRQTKRPQSTSAFQSQSNERIDNLIDDMNDWLWENIPSAFGVHVGVNGQIGAAVEGGMVGEIDFVFNWRSGQISIFGSTGPYGYLGTPTILNGTGYFGVNSYYGVSDNQYLEGFAATYGGTAGADVWGKLGATILAGVCVNPDLSAFIDPESNKVIHYLQTSVNIGFNAVPNGIEGGGILGVVGTSNWFNWDIPFWP